MKKLFAILMAVAMIMSFALVASAEEASLDCSGWWTAHTEGVEVTTDGITVTFNSKTYAEATNNWNAPIYILYTGEEAKVNGAGYTEYWVHRADNYGWAGEWASWKNTFEHLAELNGLGVTMNSVFADGCWDNWVDNLKAGVDVTVNAKLDGNGNAVVQMIANGVDCTITVPVDDSKPVYLSLTGELCTLTNIVVTENKAEEVETITVKTQVPESWASVGVWAWIDGGANAFEAWPGLEMTKGDDGWYTAEVPAWINRIIINDNGGGNQTADLVVENVGQDMWIVVAEDKSAVISYEAPVEDDNTSTGYSAGLSYASSDWGIQTWGTDAFCDVTGAGTYTLSYDNATNGAVVFVVDIGAEGGDAADVLSAYTLSDLKVLVDGVEIPVDLTKVVTGNIEGKGRYRIEIYNEYGTTKDNSPIDTAALAGASNLTVTFTLSDPTADSTLPKTGDSIAVFVALMAVSAMGIAIISKKKEF